MKNRVEFEKLPPQCQRMAIAEDVLLQIEAGAYKPLTMTYIDLDLTDDHADQPQRAELEASESCHVCALGALAVSCMLGTDRKRPDGYLKLGIHELLMGIFSSWQLDLIESAFETSPMGRFAVQARDARMGGSVDLSPAEKAISFGKRFRSNKDRLQAIMRNILDNGGQFVPK